MDVPTPPTLNFTDLHYEAAVSRLSAGASCGLPTVEIASRPSLNHAQRIEDVVKFAEQTAVLLLAY